MSERIADEREELTFDMPPNPVGSMEILPQVFFHVPRKPNWFHRAMMRLLLGWRWKDER